MPTESKAASSISTMSNLLDWWISKFGIGVVDGGNTALAVAGEEGGAGEVSAAGVVGNAVVADDDFIAGALDDAGELGRAGKPVQR